MKTTTYQQAWWSERVGVEVGLLVSEMRDLATAQLYSLAPSIGDLGKNSTTFSCLALTYDLCQPIPPRECLD